MDRIMLLQHLALADRHVVEGMEHVRQQRERVAALARRGHDTRAAIQVLTQLEETLALHISDRDRLRKTLAESSG